MMNLTIGEIVEACGGKLVMADGSETEWLCPGARLESGSWLAESEKVDTCVNCVSIDSRKVEQGGVFVATVGERVDGHKFVENVFEQGAALAIVQKTPKQVALEQGVEGYKWGAYLLVEDTLQALKDLAEYYRRKLPVKIVGITGSVGKTSTKEFIAGVLSEKYCVLKTEGNFNNEIGVPLTLLRIREEHEIAVVEMGISEFREMHRLSKMARPDICVITNIGQCHLENLKTRDGILLAKSEIFDFMAKDGAICLNGEDDKLITLDEIKGHKPHFFGFGGSKKEEVVATDIVSHGLFGSEATLVLQTGLAPEADVAFGQAEIKVQVPLPGKHMVLNAAAAACVARLLGLTEEQIAEGVSKIAPVSGRNNLIRLPKYTLIDDCYNANPASMKAAIDLLNMADTGKVAILGDMFELGDFSANLHTEVGTYAAEAGIDTILCVGEEARFMYEAVQDAMEGKKVEYFETREELLEALETRLEELVPVGSTVLLKASHGMRFGEVLAYLKEVGQE